MHSFLRKWTEISFLYNYSMFIFFPSCGRLHYYHYYSHHSLFPAWNHLIIYQSYFHSSLINGYILLFLRFCFAYCLSSCGLSLFFLSGYLVNFIPYFLTCFAFCAFHRLVNCLILLCGYLVQFIPYFLTFFAFCAFLHHLVDCPTFLIWLCSPVYLLRFNLLLVCL